MVLAVRSPTGRIRLVSSASIGVASSVGAAPSASCGTRGYLKCHHRRPGNHAELVNLCASRCARARTLAGLQPETLVALWRGWHPGLPEMLHPRFPLWWCPKNRRDNEYSRIFLPGGRLSTEGHNPLCQRTSLREVLKRPDPFTSGIKLQSRLGLGVTSRLHTRVRSAARFIPVAASGRGSFNAPGFW